MDRFPIFVIKKKKKKKNKNKKKKKSDRIGKKSLSRQMEITIKLAIHNFYIHKSKRQLGLMLVSETKHLRTFVSSDFFTSEWQVAVLFTVW